MKIYSRLLLAALTALIFGAVGLTAQNGTMTPYSRFGYGILNDNATAAQRAMGGVGYAMNSGRQINVMNPASYACIDSLTFLFDMGVDFTGLWSSEVTDGVRNSDNNFGGGLDYITMQFPLGKRMGASVGVLPFSSVGYAFGNEIPHGAASRQGSGSINQLYFGISGLVFKGFSVGINAGYLFGTTVNDTYAITSLGSTSLYENQISVRDYHIEAGIQYTFPVGRRNTFTLGAVFAPAKDFLGHVRTYHYDVNYQTTPEVTFSDKMKNGYSMPYTVGAGINWNWNQRLMTEVDFTYQPWSKARYAGEKGALADRYKVALGMEFQQSPRGSYGKRIKYRLGGFYNRDYLMVRDNNVKEYGASLGVGLPVPGYKTLVNVGVGWSHRQASPQALVKEDYLHITLGINFNEMWFRKSKIY